jgi:hypothetical protein
MLMREGEFDKASALLNEMLAIDPADATGSGTCR